MKRPLNIMFLHVGGAWLRGSELSLLSIMEGLQAAGFGCRLYANQQQYVEMVNAGGIHAEQIDFPYVMLDPDERSYDFVGTVGLVGKLYHFIRRHRVDLVYCNGGRPAQAAWFAAKLAKVPVVTHVRAPYIKRYIHLFNLHRCDATIFVSDSTRKFHTDRVDFRNPVTIHNGVAESADKMRQRPITELPVSVVANSISLCQIGAVIRDKGIETVIRALKILRSENIRPQFYFVGKGLHLEQYAQVIQQCKLDDQIHCTGEIGNIPEFLRRYVDVNVLAADWEEPFGRVIVEGYFAEKPVIASHVGGIPEIVEPAKTGYLFERGNAEELARCIRLFHQDRDSIATMGRRAREYALENFTEEALVRNVLNVINDLLPPGGRKVAQPSASRY